MNRADDISFYIPARNCGRTLDACLRSVQAQTLQPAETIVIVDTRSTDETLQVAASHPVRLVVQTDGTLGHARNLAIQSATTPWLACCDSDVTIAPDWLETLAARRTGDLAGIAGRTDEQSSEAPDRWRALHMPHHWGDVPLLNPFMLVSEVLFERAALLAVGGYRNDLNNYEDSDLCQRLRDGGYNLAYEPAARALHHRRDSLTGVLDLRWKYAEYRQRNAFDSFTGLLDKTTINREYALQTLAKTLAVHNEELAYISFLLFFHHLIHDQRALLRRRTLLPPWDHRWYERQLRLVATEILTATHAQLGAYVARDLTPADGRADDANSPQHLPPAHSDYLDGIHNTTRAFLDEFDAHVLPVIAASAGFCHGDHAASDVPTLADPPAETLQSRLDNAPLASFVDADACQAWHTLWPGVRRVRVAGPAPTAERHAVARVFDVISEAREQDEACDAVFCPHLESYARPLSALSALRDVASRAVVCYRPPRQFIPGLDVLAARDLASAAVQAGWRIVRFDTLVGRTALVLEQDHARIGPSGQRVGRPARRKPPTPQHTS